MSTYLIDNFCQNVLSNHSSATLLKISESHHDVVSVATKLGFCFSLQDWIRYLSADWLLMSDCQLLLAWDTEPTHWTWAFRQYSRWQELLMSGSSSEGFYAQSLGHNSVSSEIQNVQVSDALENFIKFVQSDISLLTMVKSCQCQEDVILLAQSIGFNITSEMILDKWSSVTDFSQPTWYGWFN